MVLPSQLIVMVGLGIAYTVTGGSSLSRIYHLYTSKVQQTDIVWQPSSRSLRLLCMQTSSTSDSQESNLKMHLRSRRTSFERQMSINSSTFEKAHFVKAAASHQPCGNMDHVKAFTNSES